ncbi:MAG: SCO family protein [Hydrotalea flava]|uniref:SCO family protein n=1 Tax=Hydrotalea TaxID=1004300 RepID=UPI001027B134|nr:MULTISPECIES: SCO family protein [Hydrotalea]MBY0346705.1 SCO family protein [Hydrotalea flava]NIM35595.1 SCO family protein [Hydrotalea flava]NIM38452.1 SCO family protein [Hydrotalea flava]NIN03622.1 SCO family protein [Hydrotalea flava]NIN15309.1 SCO family protein [Hydrotalea flava]
MNKKALGYGLFFIALIAVFMFVISRVTDMFKRSTLTERSTVQPFRFANQDGKDITNADVAGKVCVVNYFFTTCKGICPRMNNNLKSIYETFKGRPDFMILSHTCDPETDSVPRMRRYADSMQVNTQQWEFLTGRKDSLYKMARYSYGIDDPKNAVNDIKDDFIHTQFVALVDKNGIVRGQVYDTLKKDELDKLKHDIEELLKEQPDNNKAK